MGNLGTKRVQEIAASQALNAERVRRVHLYLLPFQSRTLLQRSNPKTRLSEMCVPTVLWAMHNQILLGCCENDCCLTTNFSLQFSAAQTPVVYQISPPSGIPGTGPFFRLEPTLIIIWCSIPSFCLWGIFVAGVRNRHLQNLMSKLTLNRKMGLHKESAALGTREMGNALWLLGYLARGFCSPTLPEYRDAAECQIWLISD